MKRRETIHEFSVRYSDDFAPSVAKLGGASESELNTPGARLILYNYQVLDSLHLAVHFAISIGCPSIHVSVPFDPPSVDDEMRAYAIRRASDLAQTYDEGSDEWVALCAYCAWVNACHVETTGGSRGMSMFQLLLAGAGARQIELSLRNRKDTAARRKQKKALAQQSSGRKARNLAKTQSAEAWHGHAKAVLSKLKATGTNSAIADHILSNWGRVGVDDARPDKPKKKTMQNWLSKEIPSRARSSAGKTRS